MVTETETEAHVRSWRNVNRHCLNVNGSRLDDHWLRINHHWRGLVNHRYCVICFLFNAGVLPCARRSE